MEPLLTSNIFGKNINHFAFQTAKADLLEPFHLVQGPNYFNHLLHFNCAYKLQSTDPLFMAIIFQWNMSHLSYPCHTFWKPTVAFPLVFLNQSCLLPAWTPVLFLLSENFFKVKTCWKLQKTLIWAIKTFSIFFCLPVNKKFS